MIPIFTRAVSRAVKTEPCGTMAGSGVDGSAFSHGTQATEFELLVGRMGMTTTQALQAGTIVNARVMAATARSDRSPKGKFADLVAVPGDPFADITRLHEVSFV